MKLSSIIALIAAVCCLNVAFAQDCDISVGYFSQTVTLYQAQAQGFLNMTGLSICTGTVQGSVQAYEGLQSGEYDVLQSATDNAMSRYYLPEAYPGQNVTLLAQMDGSALQIIAATWDIQTIEDLRGKNILVDSPTSGLIFTLRRVLAIHNLYYPQDYGMVALGGQRFPALYAGEYEGIPVSASVITQPQSTQLVNNPNYYEGYVRNLGVIADDCAPVAGTSLQTDPNTLLNATRRDYINRFMGAVLLGRAFILNPRNAAAVKQGLMDLQGISAAEAEIAYQQTVNNPMVGETDPTLEFNRLAFGNSAFLKATFDDRYNNSDYAADYFNPGFAKLIDYSPLTAGQTIAAQLSAVTVNNPYASNVCVFPANSGYNYVIDNAVGKLQAGISGGCKGLTAEFVSCYSTDINAAPAACQYDAASDRLTISTSLAAGQVSRQYSINYALYDLCSYESNITQTVTVQTTNSGSCVSVLPSCTVQVTSSVVSSWNTGTESIAQYSLSITNPGITEVDSLTLQISSADASRLQSLWSLTAIGQNKYTLPSWSNTIAAGSAYTQAGYISSNGPITFNTASISCH